MSREDEQNFHNVGRGLRLEGVISYSQTGEVVGKRVYYRKKAEFPQPQYDHDSKQLQSLSATVLPDSDIKK